MAKRETTSADKRRAALRLFFDSRGIKPGTAARAIKRSPATFYNFFNGDTDSLTAKIYEELSAEYRVSVEELMTGKAAASAAGSDTVPVVGSIGALGRMFPASTARKSVDRPVGVPAGIKLQAATIDGDALYPLPAGWVVYFTEEASDPETILGKVVMCRARGIDRPTLGTLRKGTRAGLYTLQQWNGGPLEDLDVIGVHAVVSMSQPGVVGGDA